MCFCFAFFLPSRRCTPLLARVGGTLTLALHYCLASTGTPLPPLLELLVYPRGPFLAEDGLEWILKSVLLQSARPLPSFDADHLSTFLPYHSSPVLACGHSVRISAHIMPVLARVAAAGPWTRLAVAISLAARRALTSLNIPLVLSQQSPCLSLPALPRTRLVVLQ